LQRVDRATFSLRLDDPDAFRRGVYLVASGVGEALLAGHLPAYAKMASPQALASLLNTATRGVAIALEFDPPAVLPSSAMHCSFRVDVRSQHWLDALQSQALVVHVPDAPPELNLALYVLRSERP
jgi:predicted component of type VI protein secretion system